MPELFDAIELRGVKFKNRIMVSPMCQYQAEADAVANDWHLVHYGSLALGGAALIMVEATAVEPRGRITEKDLGMYQDKHIAPLQRIVRFAHKYQTKIGIQLAHAGRKAEVASDIVAPSALAFSEHYKTPVELTAREIAETTEAFARAATRAVEANFDTIEIHAAHGYLLHQFLSPISNRRTDEFGGSRSNRLRFPLDVVKAVRAAIPDTMPLFVRVSGSEYSQDGYSMEDMVYFATELKAAGADIIDVSSGGNLSVRPPKIYAGYQVPFAHAIRHGADIPVCAVGLLDDPILANSIICDERADMVAVARGFLRDKHWAHRAARDLGIKVEPPLPYARAY